MRIHPYVRSDGHAGRARAIGVVSVLVALVAAFGLASCGHGHPTAVGSPAGLSAPVRRLPSSLAPSGSLSPSPVPSASRCPDRPAAVQGRCPSPGSTGTGTSSAGPIPLGALPPFAPATGKRWSLNFSEEFNGSDYN